MEVEYEPAGPKPIKRLSKDVINQIAAAEVRLPPELEARPPLDSNPIDHPPPRQRH